MEYIFGLVAPYVGAPEKSEEQLKEEEDEYQAKEKKQGLKSNALKIGGIFGYTFGVCLGPLITAGFLSQPVSAGGIFCAAVFGTLTGIQSASLLWDHAEYSDEGAGMAGAAIGGILIGTPTSLMC